MRECTAICRASIGDQGKAVSNWEIVAALLGLANVALIIRRSVWNYPFAIAMVTLYFFIFRDLNLYSDAGLQIFFLIVNVYGALSWARNKADAGEIVVQRLGRIELGCWLGGSIVAIAAWGWIMAHYTDASLPYWDGAVAMLSVAGQILMTRRYLENWWWWIVVNTLSIPLYVVKGIYLTAGLYAVFLVMAIAGLVEWRKAARSNV